MGGGLMQLLMIGMQDHYISPIVSEKEKHRQTVTSFLTTINTFNNIKNPTSSCCPITNRPFHPMSRVMLIQLCRHLFDAYALQSWLIDESTCPVCHLDLEKCYNVLMKNKEKVKWQI